MADFFTELEKLLATIERHPLLEMVEYKRFPGIAADQIKAVETLLEAPLARPLAEFYSATNGLQFQWKIKEDLSDDKIDELLDRYEDYELLIPDDEDNPMANIDILPLEESVLEMDWVEEYSFPDSTKEKIQFDGESYTAANFFQKLKPFDLFSEFSCAAFFLEKGNGDPKVMLLTDHYISWKHSRVLDFSTYLRLIVATAGMTEGREKFLHAHKGYQLPPVSRQKDFPGPMEMMPEILQANQP